MRLVLAALSPILLFAPLGAAPLLAKPVPRVYVAQGAAIKGYDAVAYFNQNQAVRGSAAHAFEWQGATWWFASQANLDAFEAAPETYAPPYGGYCAFAVSQNATAGIDPKAFTIRDGKLYLNYNPAIQRRWLGGADEYIRLADANWPGLIAP